MRFFITVTLLALLSQLAPAGQVHRVSGSSIVANSPFLPPDFNPPGEAGMGASPPVTQSQFEFRGVYQLDGDYYFHIYDQRSRRGSWIGYNTGSAGYPRIVEFEESMDRLTVELDGERLQLSMTNLHAGTAYAPGQQPATNSDVSLQSINPIRSTGPASRRPVLRSAPEPANGAVTRRVTFPTGQNTD